VGEDRFILIVSDESDRDLLPRSFEGLLGLPEGTLQPNPGRSNRGLSWAETELIRAINLAAAERDWSREQRRRFVKRGVLRDMQSRQAPSGTKSPPLPQWALEAVRTMSEDRIGSIHKLGVRVIGDPESMRVPDDIPVGPDRLEVPEVPAGMAGAALASAVQVALDQERAGNHR
jgi:hypothetical protein